jgi:hypothetical protein
MNPSTKNLFLAAAVAGMLGSLTGATAFADGQKAAADAAAKVEKSAGSDGKCMGANACKGKSDCHTATTSCAGTNSCKGKGWVKMTEKDCKKHKDAKWEKLG